MSPSDFCLKWNDHHNVFFSSAEQLCGSNALCDVTLSAGGVFFQAHKLVLSICSEYFQKVFSQADKGMNTVVYMKDVESTHMELILGYMYRGEITVKESELMQLLSTASDLQVKGLSEMHKDKKGDKPPTEQQIKPKPNPETSKPVETERKGKRKQDLPLLSVREGPEEKVLKKEVDPPRPDNTQTETPEKMELKNSVPQVLDESRNSSQKVLTDLTAEDIEEFDYDEEIAEFNGDYGDTQNFFGFENQVVSSQPKSKRPSIGKAFQCGMCEMSFDQKWLLKRHYRTHTRERPFRCSLCSRNFSLRDSCIRHIRNVHRLEMDAGDISVSNIGSFCQYDEGAGAMMDNEAMYDNEALAITM